MHARAARRLCALVPTVLILSFLGTLDCEAASNEPGAQITSAGLGRPSLSSSSSSFSVASTSASSLADGLDYDLGKGLGLIRGHEVPTSVVQSVIQAADQGNRDSLYFLGLLKLYGISVAPDADKALEYMRKAAELRHHEAMAALGVMLLHGRGGSRDFGAAAAWFRLAAMEGHVEAMWLLGRMHCEGKGVAKVDFDEANKWFHRAAAKGNARGQHHLG
ncbi:unnamed protein product, partial [Ectocarpus sp. 8 AP-2014]